MVGRRAGVDIYCHVKRPLQSLLHTPLIARPLLFHFGYAYNITADDDTFIGPLIA